MLVSIPYNPVFYSYAVVTATSASLYVDSVKLSTEVRSHLGDVVTVRPYECIFEETQQLSASMLNATVDGEQSSPSSKPKFLISTKTSWALSEALGGEDKAEEVRSPVGDAKAVKNEVEIAGMKACHIRDGAALIEYFAWLEDELVAKSAKIDEVQGADKLEQIRS